MEQVLSEMVTLQAREFDSDHSKVIDCWGFTFINQSSNDISPVQVKNSVSVYIDRDSHRDSVRDRDKNNRESETEMKFLFISVSDSVYFASLTLSM